MSKRKSFNLIGETPVYLVRKDKSLRGLLMGCMGVFPLGDNENEIINRLGKLRNFRDFR